MERWSGREANDCLEGDVVVKEGEDDDGEDGNFYEDERSEVDVLEEGQHSIVGWCV